ncbi:hypothetical protein DFH07DRAFT_860072 [Mycena maculata]|uniref:Uncharacterized protein n=1 Tax=Mycena maculata TaxID=230809 RepID=A0AAD7MI79_9AGAR|nr:hypothetical protein DFH07DRAFT_860072 [Mycena maculata]
MLDLREPDEILEDPTTGARLLPFLPVVVLPKPDGCSVKLFHRLPQGILLVVSSRGTFHIFDKFGRKQLLVRRQLAITAAYTFTDYKAQRQTMGHVLINLENPPGGKLTPFICTWHCSRSQSKSMIRLLRGYDPKIFTTWRWKMIDWMQRTGTHAHIQVCKFIVMLINLLYYYIDQRGVRRGSKNCDIEVNSKLWTNGNANTMAIVAEIPWQS